MLKSSEKIAKKNNETYAEAQVTKASQFDIFV